MKKREREMKVERRGREKKVERERQLDRSDFSDSRGDSKLFNHEDETNIQMRGEGREPEK